MITIILARFVSDEVKKKKKHSDPRRIKRRKAKNDGAGKRENRAAADDNACDTERRRKDEGMKHSLKRIQFTATAHGERCVAVGQAKPDTR